MTRAAPVISSTVSPFILSAVMKDAIWAGVAPPDITWSITSIISASERSCLSTTREIALRIIAAPFQPKIKSITAEKRKAALGKKAKDGTIRCGTFSLPGHAFAASQGTGPGHKACGSLEA
jgi:hypothetical protein